ncbi:MAG TPA: DUF2637 domain-containing protein [Micromonosporaceae bacterium]|jgi:hypothetical protein
MHQLFTTKQVRNLQRGTRGVLLFGIVTSISANVLHSLTRPEAAGEPQWRLASSAALSALAPLVLFACTELVSRIPVQSRVLGTARLIVTFAVGGFAAWVSYWHMQSVAYLLGETTGTQYVYPLIIDGLMIVATISLIELGRLARSVHQAALEAAGPETDARKATGRRNAPAGTGAQNRRRNQPRRPRPPRPRPAGEAQPRTAEADTAAPVSPAPALATPR